MVDPGFTWNGVSRLSSSSSWAFGPKVGLEEGGLGWNPSNIPASLLALYHLRSWSREYKAANRQAAYKKLSHCTPPKEGLYKSSEDTVVLWIWNDTKSSRKCVKSNNLTDKKAGRKERNWNFNSGKFQTQFPCTEVITEALNRRECSIPERNWTEKNIGFAFSLCCPWRHFPEGSPLIPVQPTTVNILPWRWPCSSGVLEGFCVWTMLTPVCYPTVFCGEPLCLV